MITPEQICQRVVKLINFKTKQLERYDGRTSAIIKGEILLLQQIIECLQVQSKQAIQWEEEKMKLELLLVFLEMEPYMIQHYMRKSVEELVIITQKNE